jgi:hypothetical protein
VLPKHLPSKFNKLTVLCTLFTFRIEQANIFGPLLQIRLAHAGKEVGPHIPPYPMRAADPKANKAAEREKSLLQWCCFTVPCNTYKSHTFAASSVTENRNQYVPPERVGLCVYASARVNAVGAVQEQHAAGAQPDSSPRAHAGQRQCAQQLAHATVSHTLEGYLLLAACPCLVCDAPRVYWPDWWRSFPVCAH